MPETVYIPHFYPPEDAKQFFKVGCLIAVAGEVFPSYASAASQLEQELGDIHADALPVSAYIIEAEETPDGYLISDVVSFEGDTMKIIRRARNPQFNGYPYRRDNPAKQGETDLQKGFKKFQEQKAMADIAKLTGAKAPTQATLLEEIDEEETAAPKPAKAKKSSEPRGAKKPVKAVKAAKAKKPPEDEPDEPEDTEPEQSQAKRGRRTLEEQLADLKADIAKARKLVKKHKDVPAEERSELQRSRDKKVDALTEKQKQLVAAVEEGKAPRRETDMEKTGGRVGELVAGTDNAWLSDLKGIRVGTEDRLLPRKEVANKYATFVAKHAPWNVAPSSLKSAINKQFKTIPSKLQTEAVERGREAGDAAAGALVVQSYLSAEDPLDLVKKAQESIGPLRKRISEARKANDLDDLEKAETELQIAQGKIFVNEVLEQFCPYYANTQRGSEDAKRVREGGKPRTDIIRTGSFRGDADLPDDIDRQLYLRVGKQFASGSQAKGERKPKQ